EHGTYLLISSLPQALHGFVLVVTSEGLIFYSSHTTQDYLGFPQVDRCHAPVFELIHTEDQQEFRRNLHWALNPPHVPEGKSSPEGEKRLSSSAVTYKPDRLPPENSSFLERSFVCRFRCLLDNSSGFLWGSYLHNHRCNDAVSPSHPALSPPLALFAISTPLHPPSILQIQTKNMIFRMKPGNSISVILGILSILLVVLHMCVFVCVYVYKNVCVCLFLQNAYACDSAQYMHEMACRNHSYPLQKHFAACVCAIYTPQSPEEGGEHLHNQSMHLPFATGEALLYQSAYPLPGFRAPFQSKGKTSESKKTSCSHGRCSRKDGVDPSSPLGTVMRQDKVMY
ncbi:AHR protein, partial [Lophotis ruficrista]|nr:AHR protein [Lophotis ruficrista]